MHLDSNMASCNCSNDSSDRPCRDAPKRLLGRDKIAQHVLIIGCKRQTLPGKQVVHGRHGDALPHPHASPHDQQHWQAQASC